MAAVKKARRLVKYEALPEYYKDNEYITDYYRCEWSLKDIIVSIFFLHNETLNIWTHFIGFVIFLGLMLMSLSEMENMSLQYAIASFFGWGNGGWVTTRLTIQSNGRDTFFSGLITNAAIVGVNSSSSSAFIPLWPWFILLGGAMACLIFSTVSHVFACHSRSFYYFFWRLDYIGISLMIVCSFFAPVYYMFSDRHPYWCLAYLSYITLVGILAIIALVTPRLSSSRFRTFRTGIFLCMGFSGVIPATHAVILHWDQPVVLASLGYEIVMGVLYALGATIYVARVPERWRPGAFDIVGHSHQIFHVCVVAAALAHAAATLIIMDWRRGLAA